ncbi:hypothetical protein LXL04_019215 [Taraxacum kok-saghyz]
MIKLFKIKERHMGNITNLYGQAPSINRSAGELRLYKDFTELSLPRNCEISFPNGEEDFMVFDVAIKPNAGFYRGGVFVFRVVVGDMYPHYAPYVKCLTKVCHPYIDSDGNVYLNILHTDWSPVITISQVVDGVYRLFTATFTSDETTMIDLTMDDYDASSSGENMHLPTTPTNLNVKRTYVYVCSMDNIYPSKRRSKMVKIIAGSRVEVMRPSRGFENSYFGAQVIRRNQTIALVRYEELIDDSGELLVEKRRIEHIRPYPPRVDQVLNEGDHVDAWDGAGWWRGRLLLECKHDYVVYFNYMKKKKHRQVPYAKDRVRIHQECQDTGGGTAWVHVKVDP